MNAPVRPLLRWLFEPRDDRGIRFAGKGGGPEGPGGGEIEADGWDRWSYARLATHAHAIAAGLVRAGVDVGDTAAVVLRSGPDFVGALFGTMLAGGTPCPIAPPMAFQDARAYEAHLLGLLAEARPAVVITEADLAPAIAGLTGTAGPPLVITAAELTAGGSGEAAVGRDLAELALVQFTSGSSGLARGVAVPYGALEANLTAIQRWLGYTADDTGASWLPVHHDMGLIGSMWTPIWCGSDFWQLRPEQFIHDPLRYLRCFGADGATVAAMPSFGLAYIARRVAPDALRGLDFSRWRALIVGAERVPSPTLEAFTRLLAPYGLPPTCPLPAYGLAEATLVVTGLPPGTPWSRVRVDARALAPYEPVRLAEHDDALDLVGCGPAVPGVEVTVEDEGGAALPDGVVGEIVVRGASLARGYLRPRPSPSLTRLDGGVLRSGDLGFRHDGQLYVLGRLGDSVKVHGRTLFAEDVEALLVRQGLPSHRVAAALGIHQGRPTVVVVAEETPAAAGGDVTGQLRRWAQGARVVLVDTDRGSIPRTSSGKPKRRQLWLSFVDGSLGGWAPRAGGRGIQSRPTATGSAGR